MVYKRQLYFKHGCPSGCDTSKLLSDGLKNKLYYDCFQKMLYHYSHHKKLFHRLVKELFVFHGVTGFEPTASPQRDTSSPVDCLRGCGRIRARLPHRALWTVPRQNSPRKNSQRANQQSHSRIFLRQYRTILSADTASEAWQLLSQKRR